MYNTNASQVISVNKVNKEMSESLDMWEGLDLMEMMQQMGMRVKKEKMESKVYI